MFFVAETEKNEKVKAFYDNAKAKSAKMHFGVSAMDFAITEKKDTYRIFVMAKPMMTNTSVYLALLVFIPGLIFGWGLAGVLIPCMLLSVRVFETNWFGYSMLKLGLRKKGYKGFISFVSYAQLVEEVIDNGTKRNLR